jgi:uncharacterized protein (DUF983 family)
MINKCPACGRTAIGPFKKWFTSKLFSCKECGTKLELSEKYSVYVVFNFLLIFIVIFAVSPFLRRYLSLFPRLVVIVIFVTTLFFVYRLFVPLVKSSK